MKTFTLRRVRAVFTRYGIEATVFNEDGSVACQVLDVLDASGRKRGVMSDEARCRFYGSDGRKVRAQAAAWAKMLCHA